MNESYDKGHFSLRHLMPVASDKTKKELQKPKLGQKCYFPNMFIGQSKIVSQDAGHSRKAPLSTAPKVPELCPEIEGNPVP